MSGFQDRMPHEIPPAGPRQYGIARSADPEAEPVATDTSARQTVEGRSGEFRVAFAAMRLPGFPRLGVPVGDVTIFQSTGPLWTQKTRIRQQPGWRPVYVKRMQRLAIADDLDLTIGVLPVTAPPNVIAAMGRWIQEVQAAVGILAAALDERIAQREVAHDLVLYETASEPTAGADYVPRVREFPPTSRVTWRHRYLLRALRDHDLAEPDPLSSGARWYLKGAQDGPTPDAVVSLWIALEALSKPRYGTQLTAADKGKTDVRWVEDALQETRLDPSTIEPSIGRLAGLRAEIVHGGNEEPPLLRDGFYVLEAAARRLIRHRLGLSVRGLFPLRPNDSSLPVPLRQLARLGHAHRKTEWE